MSTEANMSKRKGRSFSASPSEKRPRRAIYNSDDSDDDPNEEELAQLQSDNSYNSQSVSGEVGIIESIQLKNFMCHSMLGPFKFGPNVNFIVGNNGSGKSAVLTALMVGLGGKATVTNRGTSLKVFVKDGQSSADVSITLRNRGDDAFKPQHYGHSITINQRITLEGHRNYKLKSSRGAVISSKKEELTAILDHFNIQVDNPVSILTQEMSKQFLQSKNEGDKYKFFMKATQLEQMKEDYAYIMETKARTHDQIEQGAKFLEELRKHYLEKEDRYKSIAFVSEMQNELKKLQHQIAWAMVRDTEKEVKTFTDDIGVLEARTEKFVEKVMEWQTKVKDAEGKHRAMQDKLEKITQEAQALEPSCGALKVEVMSKRRAKNDAEAAYNRSQNELKRLVKDHEQLCEKIEELKTSAEQMLEPETLEKQARIEHLKEQLSTLHDQEESIDHQIKQFEKAITTYKEEAAKLKKKELELKQSLDSQQRRLKELKESKTNRLKRFGHYMPDLCDAIERAHQQRKFKYKPLGPIGAFIHLKDSDFALAVETCLKGLILAFCCDNHKDEQILQDIMSNFCQSAFRPQIIISTFQNRVYDVSQRAVVHPEFPSVLAALDIDNAVIANCLIDMRRIETILLIKNSKDARRVILQNNPPENCKEAFTMDGDQLMPGKYYSCLNPRPRILSKDVEADISHLEKEIENNKTNLSLCQQRIHSAENSVRKNEHLFKTHHRDHDQLKRRVEHIKLEISDLENVEERQSVVISTLEEEVQDNKKKMETLEEHMQEQKKKMEDARSILKEAEKEFEVIKNKIHQVEEEAGPVRDGLHEADEELEQSKSHLQHYEEKEKAHLETIKTHKNNLATREKELMEMIAKASKIHPERIEVSRTYKSLDAEMNRLRDKISSERKRTGDREEIIRELQEAKEKYQTADSEVKNLKKFIKLLDEVMVERYKRYLKFRRFLTVRCKYYFNCLLSQRSYSGKIEFDHKNEKLSITDMVNRRIAMDMMLKMADSQRYRQFVLLTPQNMSTLPTSRLIRILRMQDPERGQKTLTFHQRGDEDEGEERVP